MSKAASLYHVYDQKPITPWWVSGMTHMELVCDGIKSADACCVSDKVPTMNQIVYQNSESMNIVYKIGENHVMICNVCTCVNILVVCI